MFVNTQTWFSSCSSWSNRAFLQSEDLLALRLHMARLCVVNAGVSPALINIKLCVCVKRGQVLMRATTPTVFQSNSVSSALENLPCFLFISFSFRSMNLISFHLKWQIQPQWRFIIPVCVVYDGVDTDDGCSDVMFMFCCRLQAGRLRRNFLWWEIQSVQRVSGWNAKLYQDSPADGRGRAIHRQPPVVSQDNGSVSETSSD